eukprot:403365917
MKKTITILLSLLAISATAAKTVYELDLNNQQHSDLTIDKAIQLKVGDQLRIVVNENPTTGYVWIYPSSENNSHKKGVHDPTHFEVVSDKYKQDELPTGPNGESIQLAGIGGVRILTVEAKRVGVEHLELVHARPWEFSGFDESTRSTPQLGYHDIEIQIIK